MRCYLSKFDTNFVYPVIYHVKRKNDLMVVLNIILKPMQVVKYTHVNMVL